MENAQTNPAKKTSKLNYIYVLLILGALVLVGEGIYYYYLKSLKLPVESLRETQPQVEPTVKAQVQRPPSACKFSDGKVTCPEGAISETEGEGFFKYQPRDSTEEKLALVGTLISWNEQQAEVQFGDQTVSLMVPPEGVEEQVSSEDGTHMVTKIVNSKEFTGYLGKRVNIWFEEKDGNLIMKKFVLLYSASEVE